MTRFLPLGAIGLFGVVVAVIVLTTVGSNPARHRPLSGRRVTAAAPGPATTTAGANPAAAAPTTTATAPGTGTATTATGSATTTTTPPGPIFACDQNINAASHRGTTKAAACAVAETAFYEVYRGSRDATRVPAHIAVWDPAASSYVAMACHQGHGTVSCDAADGRVSSFPMLAVQQYSPALAAGYRSRRTVGPAG